MIIQVTFRGEEVIDYSGVDEETFESLKTQLNSGKVEFLEFEHPDGKKFLINKANILMIVLKEEVFR